MPAMKSGIRSVGTTNVGDGTHQNRAGIERDARIGGTEVGGDNVLEKGHAPEGAANLGPKPVPRGCRVALRALAVDHRLTVVHETDMGRGAGRDNLFRSGPLPAFRIAGRI